MPRDDEIRFYSTRELFGGFSNFSKHIVDLDGHAWRTSEHYFQAMKFEGHPDYMDILNAPDARTAANMGRDRCRPLRSDWDAVKDDIMRKVLRAKFTQHEDLNKLLLGTGDMTIIEDTKNDSYWGNGGDDTGKNMLGKLLVELRTQLRNEAAATK
eukprot:TRINITY_DN19156_c0_g1_i1.p1 TRINITY_DN19156_c0_g1~~TRINITY_DN19156_c0_g1_i1.p1  ORF type:complete len:155 (+),score=22.89 TRINITY_DN19156_c0_g1_i1:55-519(+)